MKISVRFYAFLADQLNIKNKIEIELDDKSNIHSLFNKICDIYDIREKLFDSNNNLRDRITILKNGREINFLSGMETIMDNGDEISVFPPVHGG